MQAYQMFQKMPASLASEIVGWMRDSQRDVYKAALQTLAKQRNLRVEFVQKKTRDQQVAWIIDSMKLRVNEGVGENVLQVWLMKARSPMLVDFMDALGVAHDGKGGIEADLPAEFDAEKVTAGVDALLAKYPGPEVAVYLHLFQLQQPGGWAPIAKALERAELAFSD